MTVHRDKFLMNKTNRRTEFQFYWYYGCTCFERPFWPSSEVLGRTSALVHFMQFWWPLLQVWWPFATRCRMELQFHPAIIINCKGALTWRWSSTAETCSHRQTNKSRSYDSCVLTDPPTVICIKTQRGWWTWRSGSLDTCRGEKNTERYKSCLNVVQEKS
jgi:hypothetical protein